MAIGTNLKDIAAFVNRIIEKKGGLCAVNNSRIIGELRLSVGGLITDEVIGHEVGKMMSALGK